MGFNEDVLFTDRLMSNELKEIKENEVVVWVDPLDGTSEVALAVKNKNLALLEQVTVLIGIAYKGRPVAGIIHQPYHSTSGRTVWAIRGCGVHGLVPATGKGEAGPGNAENVKHRLKIRLKWTILSENQLEICKNRFKSIQNRLTSVEHRLKSI